MTDELQPFGLRYNPFEPAASGAPISGKLWLPDSWRIDLERMMDELAQGSGVKALVLAGEYGSGKTYLLHWLRNEGFPSRLIRPFYFDNPGVQFYELANWLLKDIGRKEFAKSLWELVSTKIPSRQLRMFARGYEDYLRARRTVWERKEALAALQTAIIESGVASDEEIAFRLARLVAETPDKPYFEYRDFVAGKPNALVAENEEAPYFRAILRALRLAAGIDSVAFLIDEFEEISLQKRLTKRQAQDYLVTMKRLINLTEGEDLWLVVAMTPDAADKSKMFELEPALWERFTTAEKYNYSIPPLTAQDADELVYQRIEPARIESGERLSRLFPFPDDVHAAFSPVTYSTPRRLVKVCFHAISRATGQPLPFSHAYLRSIERDVYLIPDAEGL